MSIEGMSAAYSSNLRREERALFSFRSIKYALLFLMGWQENFVHGSIFQIETWINIYGPFSATEFFLIMLGLLALAERTLTHDYTFRRSYFSAPVNLTLLGLFISWCRGVIVNQRYQVVYEAHEAFLLPFALFIIRNSFYEERDRKALFKIILISALWKMFEGFYAYFFSPDPHKDWGVVQLWRDGYLLGVGMVAIMLFLHFRVSGFERVRTIVIYTAPIMMFVLLVSFRRTFIVASILSSFVLIITLGKGRRRKQVWIVLCGILALAGVVLITDPVGMLGRLSGIIAPKDEGSAYIRLLEWPNVIQNILHNPIWGTPVATQWIRYYRMPISAVYTTLGTHNTYLYYPLRGGILAAFGFFWLLARLWKAAFLNWRFQPTAEDSFFSQFTVQLLILYQVGCFFGLMYSDGMTPFMGMILATIQLHSEYCTGYRSYAYVRFWESMKTGRIVTRYSSFRRLLTARLAQAFA